MPGYQDNIGDWTLRRREGEEQLDLLAADRDRTHRAQVRKAGRKVFTFKPSYKQVCLRRNATVAEAGGSSRPWFVHGVQIVAKGKRVKITWRIQRRWMSEWDQYNLGWRCEIGGSTRSSGSGEVINHISLEYDFIKAFVSPLYPYLRDAQKHFYHDKSPSNDEVRRWLGDINDIRRRDIFINCFIRRL
ncbi:unnamed protein product, partial [Clonostachys byssicola]